MSLKATDPNSASNHISQSTNISIIIEQILNPKQQILNKFKLPKYKTVISEFFFFIKKGRINEEVF